MVPMQRVTPALAWPLFGVAATRQVEAEAAAAWPPHTLMRRAGLAVARLALAQAPHARTFWIACGPGNNGGDGFEAAMHLKQWGKHPVVSWSGDRARMPSDAAESMRRAREAGVRISEAVPDTWDFAVDAMLGLGSTRPLSEALAHWARILNGCAVPTLSIDIPSGLHGDTGQGDSVIAACTLSLLTLKPGLLTGRGRDACGELWFDDLEARPGKTPATAVSVAAPAARRRAHASHKGSYGDVAVVGGAPGMTGAAWLAASAALHAGAGRVFVALLGDAGPDGSFAEPALMVREWESLPLGDMAIVAGCGGSNLIAAALPRLLAEARSLVLDADGLNAIATDASLQRLLQSRASRGMPTVLTPHPLEAARLSEITTQEIQADRLHAAQQLAERFACVVVLKGSGTVIAAPRQVPRINITGNARLATAGTGDVLAGMTGARLAAGEDAFDAACAAVYRHGEAADRLPADEPLTASVLSRLARN